MQISLLCVPGKLWSRSLKLAYTLLNKLGTKNEPVLKPGDRVMSLGLSGSTSEIKRGFWGAATDHRHYILVLLIARLLPQGQAIWERNLRVFSVLVAAL